MQIAEFVNGMFELANSMLDIVFLWGVLFLYFSYPVYFFGTNIIKYTKEGRGRELLSQTIILFLLVVGMAIIWAIPEVVWLGNTWYRKLSIANEMTKWDDLAWIFSTVRLALFLGVFFFFIYLIGHENGKNRWLFSALGHIAVITFGWTVNFWMGIYFISLPLIAVYYCVLHDLALIVMPTSNPEDRVEQKKRINAFISYSWGIQSPMTVVDDHAWKKYAPRIPGDITWNFADFSIPIIKNLDGRPGVIWMRSHQVAAITEGTKFKRVDGPGVVFTGKIERLEQVFDLRLQLRTKEIEAVSKDGIHFMARLFAGFRIDNEEWTKETYNIIRSINPSLRGADKLSHTQGSFPYSHLRVHAALGMTSTKETDDQPIIYWDQWAMTVIEDQTRMVLSQKNLDELWRPSNDVKFKFALDVIAEEIKKNSALPLRVAGILLVVSRIVDFRFLGGETPDYISAMQSLGMLQSNYYKKPAKGSGLLSLSNGEDENS